MAPSPVELDVTGGEGHKIFGVWDAPKRPSWKMLRCRMGWWGFLDHFMHLLKIRGRLMNKVCDHYDKELGA